MGKRISVGDILSFGRNRYSSYLGEGVPEKKTIRRKKKGITPWMSVTASVIAMLVMTIPTTGFVMAQDLIEVQKGELAETISSSIAQAEDSAIKDVNHLFDTIDFSRAPNVKGMTANTAKKKLEKKYDFEVKLKKQKITYETLVEKSDTLFFGEVEEQKQDMDKVTLVIAEADMEDPLTSEMVALGGRLSWPVPSSMSITSRFGGRASPGGIGSTNHKGMDIGAPTGAPIIAAKEGKVSLAEKYGGYGNCVIVDHDNGYQTLYGHMSVITCNVGDSVKPGDIIGKVGSTGWSTGPHLHFSIIKNGEYVDPEPYLTGRNYTPPGEEVSENMEETGPQPVDGGDERQKVVKDRTEPSSTAEEKPSETKPSKPEGEETKPVIKPETSPTTKPEKKPTEKPTTKPVEKPTTEPVTEPETKPSAPSEPPQTEPETQPTAEPETKPQATKSEAQPSEEQSKNAHDTTD